MSNAFGVPARQKTALRFGSLVERSIHRETLQASVPVYKNEDHAILFGTKLLWFDLSSSVNVDDLYEAQFSAVYMRKRKNDDVWSLSAQYGSASDKPFKNSTVTTVGASAFYKLSPGPESTWVFLLNYSNNRPILNGWPLPGFAYLYTPSPDFRGVFGAPFVSVWWRFAARWSMSLFALVPWTFKAQIGYSIAGPISAFSGAEFSQITFLKHGRADKKERLYFDERKAFMGLRSPLSKVFLAELEAGVAFDRRFFSSRKYRIKAPASIDFGTTAYGKIQLAASF